MKPINFIKYIPLYFSISGLIVGAGLFSLLAWKVKPAIDFVGGSLIQIEILDSKENPNEDSIRQVLAKENIIAKSIQTAESGQWIIRIAEAKNVEESVGQALTEKFSGVSIVRFESIGPTLGKELLTKTTIGVVLASAGILFYVTKRFGGSKYGICAVLAMIHDSLVVLGSFSILGHFRGVEVDTLFVTALLTILSFSVHDTIVVYDRIRENLRKFPQENFESVANRSVNETMGRSINNSLTIILMLIALVVLGGTTIKPFALALLIGTVTGTYSSPFVAVPLLVVWGRMGKRKKNAH